ncbi:class II fructose-bisphosphatase [Methyloligella sp. 2.7D]|uniref:class II fructose-bisphosphatase n=1 Tax=unclassified Methyloligella TaxID=2625955 RepID=UPI00157C70F6|nr:class II fructose-bisphosphatase [Methyloligella sp. GL2]QKP77901.1 class II fructose-bisphosphatase [Methyloligella sp. GL2]
MDSAQSVSPDFVFSLRRATESAALAAYDWIGRGDREGGGGAALDAMRESLAKLDFEGAAVSGQVSKDEAPQFARGDIVGKPGAAFKADVAADPVEGTSYLARGQTNALAVIAVAPRGTMMDPGPAFYMEKFVAEPAARGKIDPTWPTAKKLEVLGRALNKAVPDLTVYVLEKPRHRQLVEEIVATGARVALYPAGDVAGALMAAIPQSGIDALMGIGGVPEGLISAVAIRAMGGEFLGRMAPQLQTEAIAVKQAGIDTDRWFDRDELVGSDELFFCATGITSGLLLEGVSHSKNSYTLQTMMITGATGERQVMTSYLPLPPRAQAVTARDVA